MCSKILVCGLDCRSFNLCLINESIVIIMLNVCIMCKSYFIFNGFLTDNLQKAFDNTILKCIYFF